MTPSPPIDNHNGRDHSRWLITSNAGACNPALDSQLGSLLIHLPACPTAATFPDRCAYVAMKGSPLPLPADCLLLHASAKSP
jgi:hypothetical protein